MSFIKLLKLWDNLQSGYWFIPTIIASGFVVLSVICPWLDAQFPGAGEWMSHRGYLTDPQAARTILSVIAASAITVAGVVFSITMVVLATMSAQFGPRLLPNFMRQDSTKLVMGGFIGTFVYCMLILSLLSGTGENESVPKMAVLVGLFFGILSFGLLIYFIHRVARFIQAPCILNDVAARLRNNILAYFPERAHETGSKAGDDGEPFGDDGTALCLDQEGYLQVVDMEALMEWAVKREAAVRLVVRPGDFVIPDQTVLRVRGKASLPETDRASLRSAFVVGVSRTDTQDVEFAVNQLVEVAVRALSPGINDPYTAINCIDHLSGVLALLAGRGLPASLRHDDEGRARIWAKNHSYAGILDLIFHPLRQHGKSMAVVAIRLMEVMVTLAERPLPESFRDALARHARLLHEDVQQSFSQKSDRDDFEKRHRRFLALLGA